jgi:hypothetical protein
MNDNLMRAHEVCKWLAATPLSHTIQTAGWIIPTLQTIHILSVAVLFSSAILVDLRLSTALSGRDVPLPDVARRFLPTIWPVLLILLITGSVLIIGEPRRSLLNNNLLSQDGAARRRCAADGLALQWSISRPRISGIGAVGGEWRAGLRRAVSILIWCGILFAGRWIAYTQVG